MDKTASSCGIELWIKILFMVQSFVLVTFAAIALIKYNEHEVDETRLSSIAQLIAGLAWFQLLASCVCFCQHCERHIYTPLLGFIMCVCLCTIGLLLYQTMKIFEYEKTVSSTVMWSIFLVAVYVLLVIGQIILHCVKICRFRTVKEKTGALLQES